MEALPVKGEKRARKIEERTVFFLEYEDKVAICRRPPRGLLASMWQLPNLVGKLEVQSALAAFVWATRAELSDRYALPTAFRQFVE